MVETLVPWPMKPAPGQHRRIGGLDDPLPGKPGRVGIRDVVFSRQETQLGCPDACSTYTDKTCAHGVTSSSMYLRQ
jgi:hypothetical protein